MLIEDPMVGADVEVFVKHMPSNEIISAEGLIKGTKDDPFVFDPSNKYFATSLDNVLAEFCIPPVTDKEAFAKYLTKSLRYINRTLPKECCAAILQAVSLDPKWLLTDHAQRFGCEPDFNAYTGLENLKPDAEDKCLRSAGGHIHISWKHLLFPYVHSEYCGDAPLKKYIGDEQRCDLIKVIDLHVAVPSIIMEPDNKRKELYGKAGCFRPKEYGVEYRTVSNFYLKSKKLMYWVYEAIMSAIQWYNEGNRVDRYLGAHIQNIVNNNDKVLALELINNFNLKTV